MKFFCKSRQREFIHLLLLAMLCGLFFLAPMDMRGLWEPDEARHAEMAREMVESGDWVTPRLNYVKYFEKPILAFWMIGAGFKLFGVSEASARLTPALCASLMVFVLYFIGRHLWNNGAGFWSALCLASSLMLIGLGQVVLVDLPMNLGVLIAILGALQMRAGKPWGRYCFWGGAAVGFLAKGALGAGLPWLLLLGFACVAKEWNLVRQALRLRGIILFLLLCAPWYILVSLHNPEFLPFFWDEHWQRLFTNTHSRWEPPWFYLNILLAGFLPWTAILPWALYRFWPGWRWLRSPGQRPALWVLLWLALYLLFFSASSSKMIHYALPIFPALALLTGWPLSRFMAHEAEEKNSPFLRRSLAALALLFLLLGLALPIASGYIREMTELRGSLAGLIYPLLFLLTALWLYLWRARWWMVAAGPLGGLLVLMLFLGSALTPFENWRSMKSTFQLMEISLRPNDVLVSYADAYYGINFYGKRRMVLVENWGELEFGRTQAADSEAWFLEDDQALFDLLKSSKRRVVVICRLRNYPQLEEAMKAEPDLKFFEWLRLDDKLVFGNQPR